MPTDEAKYSNLIGWLLFQCGVKYILGSIQLQGPVLLTWFNFNPGMDK